MEYVDSENGKVVTMQKNGGGSDPNSNENFENGYEGKTLFCKKYA